MSKIFVTESGKGADAASTLQLIREGVLRLFPGVLAKTPVQPEGGSSQTFFLRDGGNLLWAEIVLAPFVREEIPNYLAKASRLERLFSNGIQGILAAPEFEAGIPELMEFIRIPVRLFRYHVGLDQKDSLLCLEEKTVSRPASAPTPGDPAIPTELREVRPAAELSWNRLNREELREFIQLDLDAAGYK